ncbi:MAG: type II secretion system GspH family protein [Lentisphaerales bacterium]|nr:type II secretion system GspH family protein [Lentisphaerales bacterium]
MEKTFTLLELFVVMAMLSILVSILLPSIDSAREKGTSAVCSSNLSQIGKLAQLHGKDNSEKIPAYSFHYKDDQLQGNETEADLFTGDARYDAHNRSSFWARDNIGQYLFPNGTSDYSAHAIYSCPSSTITHNTSNGEKIEYPLSYWVNTHVDENWESPWANNWGITDTRDVYWTLYSQIKQPSTLMSVYDCAQGWNGKVQASGAGGFISHGPDIWDQPWPGPWAWSSPEMLIGRKLRPEQAGVEYWRGAVDFRHKEEVLNSVFFDGSVRKLYNGRIQNKNAINQ